MTTSHKLLPIPEALLDVALVDAITSATAGGESLSTFHDGVRRTARGELAAGEVPYPQAVVRKPRFTRYRLADVRTWLIARASQPFADAAASLVANATKASAAARTPAAVAKAQATRAANKAAAASTAVA